MKVLMAVGMMMLSGCANDPVAREQALAMIAAGCNGFAYGMRSAPQQQIPTFIPPNIQGPVIIPQQTQYTPIPPTFIPSSY